MGTLLLQFSDFQESNSENIPVKLWGFVEGDRNLCCGHRCPLLLHLHRKYEEGKQWAHGGHTAVTESLWTSRKLWSQQPLAMDTTSLRHTPSISKHPEPRAEIQQLPGEVLTCWGGKRGRQPPPHMEPETTSMAGIPQFNWSHLFSGKN